MNRIQRSGATAALVLSAAAVAGGPPARIDSEQSAAAAVVMVNDAASLSQGIIAVITTESPDYTRDVFRQLNAAAITAPALRNMPGGATLPCVNGGSLQVRMPRSFPRVLQIEWTNCQVLRTSSGGITTGPGEVVLFNDNFRPEQVASIRLGNSSRDLTISIDNSNSGDLYRTVRTRNVKMTGWIPLFSPAFDVDQHIPYAYDIGGFVRDVSDIDFQDPTQPDYHYETLNSAENTAIAGMDSSINEGYYADFSQRLLWGKLTWSSVEPGGDTRSTRTIVENLAIRRVYDYSAWTSGLSIDGSVEIQGDGPRVACTNGRLTAKTIAPIYVPNMDDFNTVESGEIRVNGVATARYYSSATVPPSLPSPTNGTLVNLDVRGVGAFNYDGLSALYAAASCP